MRTLLSDKVYMLCIIPWWATLRPFTGQRWPTGRMLPVPVLDRIEKSNSSKSIPKHSRTKHKFSRHSILNQNFLVFREFQEKQCQNPSKTETKQSKEVNVCGWVGNTLLKKLIWCLKNRCLVNSTDSMQLVYCTVCKTALEPIKYRAINGTAVLLNTIID